jgi:hypothetical protein
MVHNLRSYKIKMIYFMIDIKFYKSNDIYVLRSEYIVNTIYTVRCNKTKL